MPPDQIPPADELAAVRQKLKELEQREAELRQVMLTDPEARTGNQFAVEIVKVAETRTDWKELRADHPALAEQYTYKLQAERVMLRAINPDTGEIHPIPRRRK